MEVDEIRRRLEEEIEEQRRSEGISYPVWSPAQPGDSLLCRILEFRKAVTKFGERSIIDVEDLETGNRYSIFLSAVLERKLRERGAEPGDIALIEYGGMVKRSSKSYHIWYVAVEKSGGERAETVEEKPEGGGDPYAGVRRYVDDLLNYYGSMDVARLARYLSKYELVRRALGPRVLENPDLLASVLSRLGYRVEGGAVKKV